MSRSCIVMVLLMLGTTGLSCVGQAPVPTPSPTPEKSESAQYWDEIRAGLTRALEETFELASAPGKIIAQNTDSSGNLDATTAARAYYSAIADAELVLGDVLEELEQINPPAVCRESHTKLVDMVSAQYSAVHELRLYMEEGLRAGAPGAGQREQMSAVADVADVGLTTGLVHLVTDRDLSA